MSMEIYIMENGEYSYLYAEVNREYSVDMTLELYHDSNGDGIFSDDEQLYKHEPDELQWWLTGFDPLVQNVKTEDLQAVTTIDFFELWRKQRYNVRFFQRI